MNAIIPFSFESNQIRVITGDDGEPWFVAADILSVLALDRKALERLDDDEKGVSSIHTPGGEQDMTIVNEPGLYGLVLGSRKPEAKRFKKWVTSEVLPSIRKTGSYSLKPKSALELAKEQVALLEHLERIEYQRDEAIRTKAWIGTRREATAMATASKESRRAEKLMPETKLPGSGGDLKPGSQSMSSNHFTDNSAASQRARILEALRHGPLTTQEARRGRKHRMAQYVLVIEPGA